MKLKRLVFFPSSSGYFYDDIQSLNKNPSPQSQRYKTKASSPGFRYVRELGEAVTIGCLSHLGKCGWGSAVSVSFGGTYGRDPIFRSQEGLRWLKENADWFVDREFRSWKSAMTQIEADLPKASRAIYFGISQSLLSLFALESNVSATEIICKEWGLPLPTLTPKIHGQSGPDYYDGLDRQVLRGVDVLPHGQIDDPAKQFGRDGEFFLEYVRWVKNRLQDLPPQTKQLTFDFDVHGAMGQAFGFNQGKIVDFLGEIEKICAPYNVQIESAAIAESFNRHKDFMAELTSRLKESGVRTKLIIDEWANTLEDIRALVSADAGHGYHIKVPDLGSLHHSVDAVLEIKAAAKVSLLGGSCNETDVSARLSAHVALAAQPDSILSKPGLGVDEGIVIISGEMQRTLAELSLR